MALPLNETREPSMSASEMRACPQLLNPDQLQPVYESQTEYLPRLATQIKLLARIKLKLDLLEKEVTVLSGLVKSCGPPR